MKIDVVEKMSLLFDSSISSVVPVFILTMVVVTVGLLLMFTKEDWDGAATFDVVLVIGTLELIEEVLATDEIFNIEFAVVVPILVVVKSFCGIESIDVKAMGTVEIIFVIGKVTLVDIELSTVELLLVGELNTLLELVVESVTVEIVVGLLEIIEMLLLEVVLVAITDELNALLEVDCCVVKNIDVGILVDVPIALVVVSMAVVMLGDTKLTDAVLLFKVV